jgi:hypothetical protein
VSAPAKGRTAKITPAYGMRPVGGFGIRGWRVHCPVCGHLSRLHTGYRGCEHAARHHRCP